MICVIGSNAMKLHGILTRKPRDLDVVCSYDELMAFAKSRLSTITETYPSSKGKKWVIKGTTQKSNERIIEAELTWADSNAKELHDLIMADPQTTHTSEVAIASLDMCYMLKMSHRYLRNSPHFLKTMKDIHAMRKAGAKIRPEHKEFYKARKKLTYYYKHPSLMQDKENFFKDDGIVYKYPHDDIHESIKIGSQPAYTYFQSDNAEVQCDMNKFFAIDQQIRLNAGYEESCVLAIERAIVPHNVEPEKAFKMALMKVCTSITSGKFRNFCWEHYDEIFAMYNPKTFENFHNDVEAGKIIAL